MPTSDYHQISSVMHVVEQVQPASVLDVGVGFGKWGFLCREVLEVYHERIRPSEWRLRIEGVEIHEQYRNEFWPLLYNQVLIGDVRTLLPTLGRYDLILFCDVIEHFEKSEGIALVNEMLRHSDVVIVTSPRGFAPQGAIYGNKYEQHLSGWLPSDFERWPSLTMEIGFTFMAVLSSDPRNLARYSLRRPLDTLGFKRGLKEIVKLGFKGLKRRFN